MQGELELNLDVYPKRWFIEKNSNEIVNDIIKASNFKEYLNNPIDYNKTLSLQSLKNYNSHDNINDYGYENKSKLYVGGFQIKNNNSNNTHDINNHGSELGSNLDITIYHNDTFLYSLPIAINTINNALLSYYQCNYSIVTTYKPFSSNVNENKSNIIPNNNIYFNQINSMYFEMKSKVDTFEIVIIAFIFSIIVVLNASSIVKDKENGNLHLLILKSIKQKWYWCGILLSDIILSIPLYLQCIIIGMFSDMSIVHSKIVGYSLGYFGITLIICYFYQYSFSFFFKSYQSASNYFNIVNTLLSLFIGISVYLIYYLKQMELLESPWNNFNILLYLISMVYPPSNFILIFLRLSSSINLIVKENLLTEKILSFEGSSEYRQVLQKFRLEDEAFHKSITKAVYKYFIPSFREIIKFDSGVIYQSLFLFITLILYIVLMYLLFKKENKNLKSNKKWNKEEREFRDKVIKEGPKDVYEEWKNVNRWVSSLESNLSNGISLTVHQINKNYKKKYIKHNHNDDINDSNYNIDSDDESNRNNPNKDSDDESNRNNNDNISIHIHQNPSDLTNENNSTSSKNEKNDKVISDKTNTIDSNENLKVSRAVEDVSLQVNENECLGILGPNGAGKTTMISMIIGKESITKGEIYFENKMLHHYCEVEDTSSGLCPQFSILWPSLKVKDILEFYLKISGYSKEKSKMKAQYLLKVSGIESYADYRISELSGGTKRKLSLLISLCNNPNHLILDEPTSGVDPFTRRYIWKIIKDYKIENKVVMLLTTHSTEEAEALSDKIAILKKGTLRYIGSPQYLKILYGNEYILEIFYLNDETNDFETMIIKSKNLFNNNSYKKEKYINFERYTFTLDKKQISLIFNEMENLKHSGFISDYNFGQCSLEKIVIDKIK